VADEPGGGVPQPVAQRLGLSAGKLAVKQQRLRPGHQRLGHQDQGQPDIVGACGKVLVGAAAAPVGGGHLAG